MAPVTEVAFLPVRPGVDILDTSISEGQVMDNMLKVGKVAPGVQKNYYGVEEENASHVHLLLDWESLESHKTYQARPEYPEFLAAAQSMVDPNKQAEGCHVYFDPHPATKALYSPITEVVRAYFPVDKVEKEGLTFEADFKKLIAALKAHQVAGLTGEVSSGWSVEELPRDGIQYKVFVAFVGWESSAAHAEATKTDVFRENLGQISPDIITVAHVKFMSP